MTLCSAMLKLLVRQLLITSILAPNALCLCSDQCIEIEVTGCCTADEYCLRDHVAVIAAVAESCCEWCVTIPGEATPKLISRSSDSLLRNTAYVAVLPVFSPRRAFNQFRFDREVMATGPPLAIAHLRTIRLLV